MDMVCDHLSRIGLILEHGVEKDKKTEKRKTLCFHSDELPLRVHDFFVLLFFFFTVSIARHRLTNKADYHYLLLQSVSGIFD